MEFLVCWSGQYIYVCVNVCCLLPLQPPPLLLCSSFLTVRCRFVCCLSHCSPSPHLHSLTAPSPSCLSVCLSVCLFVCLCLSDCLSLSLSIWPLYLPASIQFVLVFSLSLSRSLSVFLLPVFALPLSSPPSLLLPPLSLALFRLATLHFHARVPISQLSLPSQLPAQFFSSFLPLFNCVPPSATHFRSIFIYLSGIFICLLPFLVRHRHRARRRCHNTLFSFSSAAA